MPAPPTNCGIIAGSAARLYICSDDDPTAAATLHWELIGDLDNYSLANDVSETNLNSHGWIRTIPTERGLTLTASGRLNTMDEGQKLVDEAAFALTCESLRFFRLVVPGARGNDPNFVDWGFWAWINRSDIGAATTDPFTWGVVLTFWDEPVDLDDQGQYTPPVETGSASTHSQPAHRQPRQQQAARQATRAEAPQEVAA